jgi:hypothetical protein
VGVVAEEYEERFELEEQNKGIIFRKLKCWMPTATPNRSQEGYLPRGKLKRREADTEDHGASL